MPQEEYLMQKQLNSPKNWYSHTKNDHILSLHDITSLPDSDSKRIFMVVQDTEKPLTVQDATTIIGYCVLTTDDTTVYH